MFKSYPTTRLHRPKQVLRQVHKFRRPLLGMLQYAGEYGIGEQLNILGKHAEDESVDEMGNGLGVVFACTKPLCETRELLCGFFREHLAGLAGL
jgi:hypothetical protein